MKIQYSFLSISHFYRTGRIRYFFALMLIVSSLSLEAQCPDTIIDDGLIYYENGGHDILKSIGRWDSKCTATFIKTSDDLDAPAYVLTNGHCVDLIEEEANQIKVNYNPPGNGVIFNFFINTLDHQIKIDVEKVEYATMKGVDLAIARLDKTIGEMIALGLQPIGISQEEPQVNDDVKIVGIPSAGIDGDSIFLRLTSCSLTGKSPLVLENTWFWRNMFENECSNIVGGSSGSPVFNCYDKGLYGMINTTNADFDFPCELASPCEVNSLKEDFDPNTNYVVDVRNILDCFNAQGYFDTSLPDFPLDLGNQITPEYLDMRISGGLSNANQINPDLSGSLQNLEINLSGKDYYRYKFMSLNTSSPWDIDGYSDVFETSANTVIQDPIPPQEGVYFVSIIAGDSPTYNATWQDIEDATVIPVIVDTTPPTHDLEIYDTGLALIILK